MSKHDRQAAAAKRYPRTASFTAQRTPEELAVCDELISAMLRDGWMHSNLSEWMDAWNHGLETKSDA